MTTPSDAVSEHITRLIGHGQRVYDCDGNKVGTVELYEHQAGMDDRGEGCLRAPRAVHPLQCHRHD